MSNDTAQNDLENTTPRSRHSDDAKADDGLPTDAYTDDVRADSAADEPEASAGGDQTDAPATSDTDDSNGQASATGPTPDEADIPTLSQNDGGIVEPPD